MSHPRTSKNPKHGRSASDAAHTMPRWTEDTDNTNTWDAENLRKPDHTVGTKLSRTIQTTITALELRRNGKQRGVQAAGTARRNSGQGIRRSPENRTISRNRNFQGRYKPLVHSPSRTYVPHRLADDTNHSYIRRPERTYLTGCRLIVRIMDGYGFQGRYKPLVHSPSRTYVPHRLAINSMENSMDMDGWIQGRYKPLVHSPSRTYVPHRLAINSMDLTGWRLIVWRRLIVWISGTIQTTRTFAVPNVRTSQVGDG